MKRVDMLRLLAAHVLMGGQQLNADIRSPHSSLGSSDFDIFLEIQYASYGIKRSGILR